MTRLPRKQAARPCPTLIPAVLLVATVLACLPAVARADCSALARLAETGIPEGSDVDLVQRGLRTALNDPNPQLGDGRLGAYTISSLQKACSRFPLPENVDSVTGTLTLAEDYGTLANIVPDWQTKTSETRFSAGFLPAGGSTVNAQILPFLGPVVPTANALLGVRGARNCADLATTDLTAQQDAGRQALQAIDPDRWPDAVAICTTLDLAAGASATTDLLGSLGALETAQPGAVNAALSVDFALWLGEQEDGTKMITTRGPRLVGSDAVLSRLIADYLAADRPTAQKNFTGLFTDLPASCDPPQTVQSVTNYFEIDQEMLDALSEEIDVSALLVDLEGETFQSAAALSDAVTRTLTGQVSRCALDQLRVAVTSEENFGQSFSLDPETTANLALNEDVAPNAAVIETFVGLTAPSRAALLAGLRAALQRATQDRVMAEVAAAAAVVGAAAEQTTPFFDTPQPGVPEFEAVEDLALLLQVTEATDQAIIANVTDPDFVRVLRETSFAAAPNVAVLEASVIAALRPVAETKITRIVNRDLAAIQTAVRNEWGLTDVLQAAIAAAPAVKRTAPATTAPDAQPTGAAETTVAAASQTYTGTQNQTDGSPPVNGIETLPGVTYPTVRLLDAAFAAIDPPLAPAVLDQLQRQAPRSAPDPEAPRDMNIALPDCGCVQRRKEFTEIYAFYPFWDAPQSSASPPDTAPDTTVTDTAETGTTTPAETGQLVDFGHVSRVAFYGLELTSAGQERGQLLLNNRRQWIDGERAFVDSAHRHRAKADLAVQLTGWQTWDDTQYDFATTELIALTKGFRRTDTGFLAALPDLLDPSAVDGLTLILTGYDGAAASNPGIDALKTMIGRIHREGHGQRINIALDLDLGSNTAITRLFRDLASVMQGSSPAVDLVLVFLQRPTTDSKKILRRLMDNSAFRGEERRAVLRRIIPVLPPGGHENLLQSRPKGQPPAPPFSQFVDDLIYFNDNFKGVGFWPAPDPAAPDAQGMAAAINSFDPEVENTARWYRTTLPAFLDSFEDQTTAQCRWICPNRTYIAAALALIAIATALLVWRSYYSGKIYFLAFKLGLAWLGALAVFAGLLALTICDHAAVVPQFLLLAMIAAAMALAAFYIYQDASNGAPP